MLSLHNLPSGPVKYSRKYNRGVTSFSGVTNAGSVHQLDENCTHQTFPLEEKTS